MLSFAPAALCAATAPPPITVPFDHFTTGFELDGVHRDLPCESCHLNAVFKATPRTCGACHMSGSQFNATPKTTTHIPSTNNCVACHNTTSFRPQMHFDHAEVLGSCVSCHNGSNPQALGKDPKIHPKTSDLCEACHTVLSWNPPKVVDHTQMPLAVEGFCIICHNGVDASGKSKNHIATNLECGDCHLTITWKGARFDHTGIVNGCANCHNGIKAVGKQGNHMPTTNLCESCHTTGIGTKVPSWTPSKFDHTQMTVTTCATCHSGTFKISTGFVSTAPTNHVPPIPPLKDCAFCHGNTPAAETWDMIVVGIPGLHTGFEATKNCAQCHAGQTFAGKPAPYIPMAISGVSPTKLAPLAPPHIPINAGVDCSSCHDKAYNAGGFGPATGMTPDRHTFVSATCDTCHDTGKSFYVGSGTALQLRPQNHVTSTDSRMATGDCGQCHTPKDWKSSMMPTGHMPNPASQQCMTCHTSAPNDYTAATLASVSVLHTGITGTCALCHGDYSAALTWANNFTPKDAMLTPSHIPYLSGADCSSCHTANYVTGGFGPTNMSAAKHAFVPTSCDTCHEAGLNFFLGASTPPLQGRPADHLSSSNAQMVSSDCSNCHQTTNWTSNAMPAGHMPNPGNQACAVCHTAITSSFSSYAALAGISVLHTGISSNCTLCHGGTTSALTFYGTPVDDPKAAILTPSHIPYLTGTDCNACHNTNYIAGGFGATNMSATKHAFVPTTCSTCHDTGKNFYVGTGTALQTRPISGTFNHLTSSDPLQATGDCSQCHNTTAWTTLQLPPKHMPNPNNSACTVCHVGAPSNNVFATNAAMHTGIANGCAQCHGGATNISLTFAGHPVKDPLSAATLTAPHIPSFANNDCSACHTTNFVTGGFGPMNMTQATHVNVSSTPCKTCHEAGASFFMGSANPGLQGRPADHTAGQQVAPNDCALCHTTANWSTTVLPSGHMPNPANLACNVCHTAAPINYTTLAANSVLHSGISGNCAQCHGVTQLTFYNHTAEPKSAALAPPHIPLLPGTDCSTCHTSTTYAVGSFGPMNMSVATHSFVTTTCVTCHEKGLSFSMGAANPALQPRPTTGSHASGPGLTSDCSVCHTTKNWTTTSLPSGHMPNPANQACTVCHISPITHNSLNSNASLHTGIASGCISCHGAPNSAAPVFAVGFTPKAAAGLAPPHIPTGSTPCEACHSASNFTSFGGTAMNVAKHSAMFATIGTTCDACHDVASNAAFYPGSGLRLTIRTDQGNDHFVGRDCSNSGCHVTSSFSAGHAQTGVQPKTRSKIATVVSAPALATLGGRRQAGLVGPAEPGQRGFSIGQRGTASTSTHAGITGNCISCHNGTLATGKSPTHIASSNTCGTCHSTIAWLPAHFDHQGVSANCSSCHNGVNAPGKPINHIATHDECSVCHGTVAWRPVIFSHTGLRATCQSCHNGIAAVGKQVQHMITTQDCSICHNTLSWTLVAPPKPQLKPLLPGNRKSTGGGSIIAPKNGPNQ